MHSSGRGEESPEAYRGVVLPSVQQQPPAPYGDQVQPASGSPWGTPAAAAPPQPEPADATQMLPPYPGGAPAPGGPGAAPVADATQMLPPYPGGTPAGPAMPQQAPVPAVPPLPPAPPQAPQPQPAAHLDPAQQSGPPPGQPADATQALPLSIFAEQQPPYEPSYEQPSYQDQQQDQQQNLRHQQQPSFDQAYPQQQYGGQEYGGGYPQEQPQQPGPQHDSDYDHLFRNDVPSPPPLRQRIIQPPSQQPSPQHQDQQPYGQGAGRPPYGQQGYESGYAYDDQDTGAGDGGGHRMSPKVLIGIVVAGCVVAGLVVGGLLNSGGSASADNEGTATPTPTAPSVSASSSGSAGGSGTDSATKQQAQSLDALLNTSGASRSSVVNAVESVKNCKDLAGASADLRSAATQRNGLVTQLGALSVDKLPGHADLTDSLTKAWQASAAADVHYARWGDQIQHNHKLCKGGHARTTAETLAGNRQSGTATEQKKRAVRLWNTIAKQYGLTERQYSQL